MLVTSVVLYALALAVLFRLYLPNRYTYPLLPFSCVAIAVAWRPTFESLGHRLRPALAWVLIPLGVAISLSAAYLAVRVVPLGPRLTGAGLRFELDHGTRPVVAVASVVAVVACALVWKRGAAFRVVGVAAVLAGTLLLAEVAIAGRGVSLDGHCSLGRPVLRYLGTLPKDAIIAGDPTTIGCVTLVSERPVVISRKLYQVFSAKYLSVARSRMFAMVDAYFGESRSKILALRQRYGADYIMVQPRSLAGHTAAPAWRRMAPFTGIVRRLLRRPMAALPCSSRLAAAPSMTGATRSTTCAASRVTEAWSSRKKIGARRLKLSTGRRRGAITASGAAGMLDVDARLASSPVDRRARVERRHRSVVGLTRRAAGLAGSGASAPGGGNQSGTLRCGGAHRPEGGGGTATTLGAGHGVMERLGRLGRRCCRPERCSRWTRAATLVSGCEAAGEVEVTDELHRAGAVWGYSHHGAGAGCGVVEAEGRELDRDEAAAAVEPAAGDRGQPACPYREPWPLARRESPHPCRAGRVAAAGQLADVVGTVAAAVDAGRHRVARGRRVRDELRHVHAMSDGRHGRSCLSQRRPPTSDGHCATRRRRRGWRPGTGRYQALMVIRPDVVAVTDVRRHAPS